MTIKLPAKKKEPEAHPNHERWIISYADLLTLLLATFVVLYASSTRNRYKEQEVAQSFIQAFHGTPPAVLTQHPSGSHGVLQHHISPIPEATPRQSAARSKLPETMAKQLANDLKALQQLHLELSSLFRPMIEKNQVSISNAPLTVTIKLDASVLFASGQATLKPQALTLLSKVGAGLTKLPAGYRITVQGYTDNKPISTVQFPSNWSLSAERAVAVVRLFIANGVSGNVLAAEGFGEFSPIASDNTHAGRALNRRVVVVIHAPQPLNSSPKPEQPQG